ncbi:D-glycerate 2-kinase [Minicystis rosea]|nr:D-glycerate 2-kinase [Minicystis rosea]
MMTPRDLRRALVGSLQATLAALDPARIVHDALPNAPDNTGRVVVIAAGKAAAAMATGAFARWPDRIDTALVVTVAPHASASTIDAGGRAVVRAAAHPIPDARSVAAAEEALALAAELGPDDLLLTLISGGASALLACPPAGMTLLEKQAVVAALLDRGVPIRAVNLVRRHLSRIKGGRLAQRAAPAKTMTLIASDVIDGEMHDIGSGPTVPDPTTIADARSILETAAIPLPRWLDESLKPSDPVPPPSARIIVDPARFGRALADELTRRGLRAITDRPDEGDALAVVERRLARAADLAPGEAIVIPCEPTITLPAQRGHGGRAGFIALAAMRRLPPDVALLCAASDGIDGSSGAAGAIVMRDDATRADQALIDTALAAYDDASAHRALGTRLAGGPTGHNLADVHVLARR